MTQMVQRSTLVPLNASAEIAGSNNRRRSLIIGSSGLSDMIVSFNGDATATNGIRIPLGATPLILAHHVIGDALTGPISAMMEDVADTIGVVEFMDN
jgi:hypothetical protein